MKVAIVGAGITGCLLASKLDQDGHKVSIYEKSRGRGGRCSHKRLSWGSFDMGAPIIQANSPEFKEFMAQQEAFGLAVRWPKLKGQSDESDIRTADQAVNYVFPEGISHASKAWTKGVELVTQCRIQHLQKMNQGWLLWDDQQRKYGAFDWVFVTAPYPQTVSIVETHFATIPKQKWQSCWTIALQYAAPTDIRQDLIYENQGDIETLVRDSAKPGRTAKEETWVGHFSPTFSAANEAIQKAKLLSMVNLKLKTMVKKPLPEVRHFYCHYWRLSRPAKGQKPIGIIFNENENLAAGGDWSYGTRGQSAFDAATELHLLTRE